jgi:hypothetical protein
MTSAADPVRRVCTRCVMDESASDIRFNGQGVCNYCTEYLVTRARYLEPDPVVRETRLAALVAEVKAVGRGKRYDCIIGISGGVDSSWALVKAVELGLRPLAVHMDNGWNAEVAQNNIANLVRGLGVDLHTHVIDWPEYRGLMEAFFKADVIDVELLYDNATEGMRMPPGWNWFKYDMRNIVGISRQFGGPKLKTFPTISTLDYTGYHLRGIRWISFLDYFEFQKAEALELLTSRYGYKPYPFKHYESVFTRFYQGFILPTKFGVDKRRLHLSTLIMNGEMTRAEAIEAVGGIAYASERLLRDDTKYFLKKMGWSQDKLDDYIARPEKRHDAYPSERKLWERAIATYRKLRRCWGSAEV